MSKLVNGKSVEIHVCEKCIPEINQENLVDFDMWEAVSKLAAEKGKPDPGKVMEEEAQISAKSLLIPSQTTQKGMECPSCGFTGDDLRKTGRLGCPDCYAVFQHMLQDVFTDCQKGTKHAGKIPNSFQSLQRKRLEEQLNEAIVSERFEEAAVLRDKLNNLLGE